MLEKLIDSMLRLSYKVAVEFFMQSNDFILKDCDRNDISFIRDDKTGFQPSRLPSPLKKDNIVVKR